MQTKNLSMGIDLGGTQVRTGLVQNGKLIKTASARLAGHDTQEQVLNLLCSLIEDTGLQDVTGIGIGVPSIVDVHRGIVYDTVNIPSWKEVHLKTILEEKYSLPVKINNDANCFALGEQRYGAGMGCGNLVGATIGTGLGAGIIMEGRLINGANCGAGEIGNIGYLDSTIEAYASGQYFTRVHGRFGESLLSQAIIGDKQAHAVFHEYGLHLGRALLTIVYAYDPEMIVLGGSVSRSFSYFKSGMEEALRECVFPHALRSLRIQCSTVKDIAIIGAACLAE